MKKEKKKEEQYINSPLNNPMLNYDVYVPGKGERIVVSILFFLIGGCVGMVFYGNLFMRDGMATTATYISNLVFFVIVGVLAVRFAFPVYIKNCLEKRKNKLKLQFRDMLESLTASFSSGSNVQNAFQAAYEDLNMQYEKKDYIVVEMQEILNGIAQNINIEDMMRNFGDRSGNEDIRSFADVFEVAIGADLCAKQEAEDFLKEVPDELPFMATSCCPAWSVMAKKLFPEHAKCISMALTPMTLTARLIKQHNPDARVVFIGPCAAKKLEAMRRSVRSEVDFVLTFEEMTGIFSAKHVDLENIEEDPAGVSDASTDGRNFAVAGGVAQAVVNVIKRDHPDQEIKVANAEGLKECRQLLKLATLGKYPGYLLEGMACPGGCVAGAGTMQAIKKSQTSVGLYAKQSTHKTSSETEYIKELNKLVD